MQYCTYSLRFYKRETDLYDSFIMHHQTTFSRLMNHLETVAGRDVKVFTWRLQDYGYEVQKHFIQLYQIVLFYTSLVHAFQSYLSG